MKKWIWAAVLLAAGCARLPLRTESEIEDWEFRKDHKTGCVTGWERVTVPHDWAIYGPFDRENDLQEVAVFQNGEETATVKTGRTGGLPYVGKGAYRTVLDIDPKDNETYFLMFDGAMSEAHILVDGKEVCFWPYGYNSFWCDITEQVRKGGNEVCVLLENLPQSSRWYPGAGLFRKVRLLTLPKIHIPVWGTWILTPEVSRERATVEVRTSIEGIASGEEYSLRTTVVDESGKDVASDTGTFLKGDGEYALQTLLVENPDLWSPETPHIYRALTEVIVCDAVVDSCSTKFGIRDIEFRPDGGFFLNGEVRKFKGICLHHDLGPLGAAVSTPALRHQLEMLKDMGCDAIRTSHNMPAEELVELCDRMGFMMMLEPFDEWDVAKCENGYHRWFDKESPDGRTWAERDMVNMLRHYRNNPSVVMWSIGNEVPSQWAEGGAQTAVFLRDICRREDPSRPVTCGMDQFDAVVNNGFAALLDVPGFNYKPRRYTEAYGKLPQKMILGSESASTVSSRGVYHLPAVKGHDLLDDDHQCSSYD
ncbi:MAG: glycoside hydrolase family 2 TIM barrel-domain containing protein, partial [Candidatus Cryptobacteroides sp.]